MQRGESHCVEMDWIVVHPARIGDEFSNAIFRKGGRITRVLHEGPAEPTTAGYGPRRGQTGLRSLP
jgi:hypothetical protein